MFRKKAHNMNITSDGAVETRQDASGFSKANDWRLFYGRHETHVSEADEADLHKQLLDCEKNPGHRQFVPVCDFETGDLPESYRDDDIVEFIRTTAHLTVRVDVKMTSAGRPDFWPHTSVPYAFHNMRGIGVRRTGTGMIRRVDKYRDRNNNETCKCQRCLHSGEPSTGCGEIRIYTATHVVFDDVEARHTTCRLFYDRPDSPFVTLDGLTMVSANAEEDWCLLRCEVNDAELLDRLDTMVRQWQRQCDNVTTKYVNARYEDKLLFIVSHPHGCPKQVSVGRCTNRYAVGDVWSTKCTYTTCTCPGSSGANVHSLGYGNLIYARHVHSGVNFEGSNFSGVGRDYPLFR